MKISDIRPEVYTMAERAQARCEARFRQIDAVAEQNTRRVMQAFQDQRVSDSCFAGTTGYGYDDLGRDTLDRLYAQIFGTESALVRIGFVNGTHALSAAMFSLAAPGEAVLAVTGTPYDTLQSAIGLNGATFGSLRFYGIEYHQVDLAADGGPGVEHGEVPVEVAFQPCQHGKADHHKEEHVVDQHQRCIFIHMTVQKQSCDKKADLSDVKNDHHHRWIIQINDDIQHKMNDKHQRILAPVCAFPAPV